MNRYLFIVGFWLTSVSIAIGQNIVAGEYFWDTDPGIGLGTALSPAEIAGGVSDETFDLNVTVPASGGQHILCVRFKLNDTLWSQIESYPILIGPENLLAGSASKKDSSEIKEVEYYWNTNSGNTQTIIVSSSDSLFYTQFDISSAGADIGNNLLNFRAKDKYGLYTNWQQTSVLVFGGLPEIDSIQYARFDSQYSYIGTPPNDFLNVNFQLADLLNLSVNTGNPADSSDVTGQKYIPAAGMINGLNVLTFKIYGSEPIDPSVPSSEDSYFFQTVVKVDNTIELEIGEPHLANNTLSTEFCPGGILKLPVQKIGNWPSLNDYNIPTVFTMKLKDVNSPDYYAITTSLNTTGDTLIGVLPENIPISSNNRVMVESSFPYITDTAATAFTSGLILTTFTGNANPCEGSQVFLNVNSNVNASYSWTGPASYTATGATPSRSNLQLTHSGSYIVTGTSLVAGCTSTANISITVKPKPVTVVSSNSPVCEGQTIQLNSSSSNGGNFVAWNKISPNIGLISNSNSSPGISNVALSDSGRYQVAYALNGCSKLDTVSVTVKPLPVISSLTTNAPICSGNNLNASVSATNGSTYSWTGPNTFSNGTNSWSIPSATTAASGTYSLTVTLNGCSINSTVVNTVNPTPVVNTTSPVSVCEGTQLQLNVTATAGGGYAWAGPNTFSSLSQNPVVSSMATTTMNGTYSVTVTLGSCSANGTVTVMVNPKPVLQVVNQSAQEGGFVNLTLPAVTAGSSLPPGTTLAYFTNQAATNPLANASNITASGTYYIKATAPGTCIDIKPVVVSICGGIYDPITAPISSGTVVNVSAQKITAANVISGSGTIVTYRSGVYVELKPGFSSNTGTVFLADIGGCN